MVENSNKNLENLTKYAKMGLALTTPDVDVKYDATKSFYMGCGVDRDDPVIGVHGSLYTDAQEVTKGGGSIDETQFGQVVNHYGGKKYMKSLEDATIKDIISNAEHFGYHVPEEAKIGLAPYMGTKYSDILKIGKAAKDAEKKIKDAGGYGAFANKVNELAPLLQAMEKLKKYAPAINAISNIERMKLKGKVQSKVLEEMTDIYLKELFKK